MGREEREGTGKTRRDGSKELMLLFSLLVADNIHKHQLVYGNPKLPYTFFWGATSLYLGRSSD